MFSKAQKVKQDPKSISFNELIEMKQAIDREIVSRRDTEIEALKTRAIAAASALGIPLTELLGIHVPTMPVPEPRRAKRAVKVRYRDPESPDNVWTGRGRPPKWLQDKLDQGVEKEAFRVQ